MTKFAGRKNTPREVIVRGVKINFDERQLTVRGKEEKLTRIEWLLLSELAINAGHLMTYYQPFGDLSIEMTFRY